MIERRAMRNFDVVLVLLAVALVAYGGLLLYSASLNAYPTITMDHPLTKQMIFAVLGVGGMIVVAWMDYRVYGQMATGLYVLAVVLLAAVLVVGDSAYGSTRWFRFAGQQIQASEVAKLLVIVSLARYLADRQHQMADPRVFVISLAMVALPAGLVLIEPDMGTAAVFGAIWLGMVAMAGAPPRYLVIALGVALAAIPFMALLALGDYQIDRFRLWIDPASDPLGGGFNIRQVAVGQLCL